mgnify:CR=1 FL=1|jgi:nucleoside-diphosphate-sugar epimerase|tara:strand:+ start:794 stop:994 length:201 start_codon:yes stop_codon:yes gene_type:complete
MNKKYTKMKKILLVGGEGYIGKVIAEKLIKKNYYVYSFDNLLYEQEFSLRETLEKQSTRALISMKK